MLAAFFTSASALLKERVSRAHAESGPPMARRRETGGGRKRGNVPFIHYQVNSERYFESTQTGDERAARSFLAQRPREIREGTQTPERGGSHTLTAATYLTYKIEGRFAGGVCNVSDEEL